MSLLSRLEARYGRYAVQNFAVVIVVLQAAVYFIDLGNQQAIVAGAMDPLTERVTLDTAKVFEGEWWRIFGFLIQPPGQGSLIGALLYWYVLYWTTSLLEAMWGAFRTNVFMLIGYVASIVVALVPPLFVNVAYDVPNHYYYATTFLAVAQLIPDMQILLFFVLPVKIKWLARFQWFIYGLNLAFALWPHKLVLLAAISNFMLFFGSRAVQVARQAQRRQAFQAKAAALDKKMVHECKVCGLSSEMSPKTAFRYCSKCEGQACYCPEHIRNHQCIGETAEDST